MLTKPIFRPWRPLWDASIPDATRRLDELVTQRQAGRQVPPVILDWSDAQPLLLALNMSKGRVSSSEFVDQKIKPILVACVWPRWLLLESALDHAANSGDLHLSALILRSQIEELDPLLTLATVLWSRGANSWDADAMAAALRLAATRVLPRLQTKTAEQLVEQASDAAVTTTRAEPLRRAFDRLSEFVHPNYGSHVLSVRPHDIEAAKVIVCAFLAIYEAFQTLPWANEGIDDSWEEPAQRGQPDSGNPYSILADDTMQLLNPKFLAVGEEEWDDAAECFRHRAASEDNWASADGGFPIDVGAILKLSESGVPTVSWPEALRTEVGRSRYAFLVAQEQRLAQDAALLAPGTDPSDDKQRIPLLFSGLNFAMAVTEYKLDSLALQAARLINANNVLGATLAVRSMLEHHAIAVELGDKLLSQWERAEKLAPSATKVAEALAEAEKQVARVLAGSSDESSPSSAWRDLWRETVRKPYNVLGPVKALDLKQTGFLQTYGLLSHIMHGTVGTGGDLLGTGGEGWRDGHKHLAAQLTHILAMLCKSGSMLDRQASSVIFAHRLDTLRHDPLPPEERIKTMRLLDGQRLKAGRDINGSGTEDDPYRFRDGLLYHDAYNHYLKQNGVRLRSRMLVQLGAGIGDRVEAEDGRVLYFLNDKL